MDARSTTDRLRACVQVSLAVGRIAARLRHDPYGAWAAASDAERRAFARRVLGVRLKLNRAGLLRWRVVRTEGVSEHRASERATRAGPMTTEVVHDDGYAALALVAIIGLLLGLSVVVPLANLAIAIVSWLGRTP